MTSTLATHTRFWPSADGLIDYDSSDHVVTAASKVVRWKPRTHFGDRLLFNVVHWGYGSAAAIQYDEFRRLFGSEAKAALAFYVVCQATACTLFPVLGETPPPWRWRRQVLLSSLAEHALYVVAVVIVSRLLRARQVAATT